MVTNTLLAYEDVDLLIEESAQSFFIAQPVAQRAETGRTNFLSCADQRYSQTKIQLKIIYEQK